MVKNYTIDLAKNQSGQAFTLPQQKVDGGDYGVNATGSPFSDCGAAVPGVVAFPYSCKQGESVTLLVTDEEGEVAYKAPSTANGTLRVFYIQVTKIGDTMHNDPNGADGYLAGTAENAGNKINGGVKFNYIIMGDKTGIIGKGSFTSPTAPATPSEVTE